MTGETAAEQENTAQDAVPTFPSAQTTGCFFGHFTAVLVAATLDVFNKTSG